MKKELCKIIEETVDFNIYSEYEIELTKYDLWDILNEFTERLFTEIDSSELIDLITKHKRITEMSDE